MSLLAFLTGLSSGTSKSVQAERDQARQEQEAELAYRRTNLEHMVKAAEEGRVNPDMVGRVYEEYMNSMQGLSGRPQAKGMAGFKGRKDIGENSLMRDLATGAVSMFGPKPGAMNIDWKAAEPTPKTPDLPTGMPGMPSVPSPEIPGRPLNQLISEDRARAIPSSYGALYKHPETVEAEKQYSALEGLVGEKGVSNAMQMALLDLQYGGRANVNEGFQQRYAKAPSPGGSRTLYEDAEGNLYPGIYSREAGEDMIMTMSGPIPLSRMPIPLKISPRNIYQAGDTQYWRFPAFGGGAPSPTNVRPKPSTTEPWQNRVNDREDDEVRAAIEAHYDSWVKERNRLREEMRWSAPPGSKLEKELDQKAWENIAGPETLKAIPTIEKLKDLRGVRMVAAPSTPTAPTTPDTGGESSAITPAQRDLLMAELAKRLGKKQ